MNVDPLSFELFPPKTKQGLEKLHTAWRQLNTLSPSYFSVTFGAGGSTQDTTLAVVNDLRAQRIRVAPHLSCIGLQRSQIKDLLAEYIESGIRDLVVIRGDFVEDQKTIQDGFQYADELVAFVRQQTGDHFHIKVAAYPEVHPQALNAHIDLEHFKRKVDAGADVAITQY
ncbi:MAG: methylenetetrahydrofolate reductase, partial [Gammaproteobacteria bacterium]